MCHHHVVELAELERLAEEEAEDPEEPEVEAAAPPADD
jgi:hypothetical protein